MRFRVAILMLFAALPGMKTEAAPVPAPSAVLDIGPPPEGETAEAYCKREIHRLTHPRGMPSFTCYNPEVKKLPSVAPQVAGPENAGQWLADNLEVKPMPGSNRLLRLRFRAGDRSEQVVILNTLLRLDQFYQGKRIKHFEDAIQSYEKGIPYLENRIKTSRNPQEIKADQKAIDDLRSTVIPAHRAKIAWLKQSTVIRWVQ